MNVLAQGAALFFSREELAAAHFTPETLTEEEALSLICRALRQENRPIPPCMEVQCFPDRHGILFFLRPRMEDPPRGCFFSVTFS